MICPVCDADIQPAGFVTGFQELVAGRIHLKRDHSIYKTTLEAAELRVAAEEDYPKSHEVILIDTEKYGMFLEPNFRNWHESWTGG